MADQRNRGGQKDDQNAARGTTTGGAAERSDADKRQDQATNPDDARRQPTDQDRPRGEQKPTVHRTGDDS